MAKPIKATPNLVGEEANKFLREMLKLEKSKITTKEKKLAEEIRKNFKLLTVCQEPLTA